MNLKKIFFFLALSFAAFGAIAQKDASSLLKKADSLWNVGEHSAALKVYKKAYKTAPKTEKNEAKSKFDEAYLNYANLLLAQERLAPSKSDRNFQISTIYYKKYLKSIFKDKNSKAYQDSLARFQEIIADAYFASEQYQAAGRTYKKILKQLNKADTDSEIKSEIALQLAQCYVELKNYPKAGKTYAQAYGDIALSHKAEELYCKGYYSEAARLLSYLRSGAEGEDRDLHTRLIARAYFKAGSNENALYWYKQYFNANDSLSKNTTIYIDQNCESCGQLLKNERYFFSMLKEKGQLDIDRFYYAQVKLNLSGKLIEASRLINNTTIVYQGCEEEEPCLSFEKTYHLSKLTSLGINTSTSSEYSPMYFENDTLIFASDRNPQKNKREEVNGEDRSTFDLYQQRMNKNDVFGFHPGVSVEHADSVSLPSRFFSFNRDVYYNEGPIAFYPGTKEKFIFTGNYFTNSDALKGSKAFDADRINTLKLFTAEWSSSDSTWKVTPILFEGTHDNLFNSELYSVAHPSFNEDGTTLYFSSNVPMPGSDDKRGSYGNSDIFRSTFDPNTGKLGTPENLGSTINSEGNELFPYLYTTDDTQETRLYFSSNFHEEEAQGQLDIYYAGLCDGIFRARENMGAPINSPKDDFGIVLNKQGTAGYLSSDREGSDDIYKFRELKILITVFDKAINETVSEASIDFIPEVGQFDPERMPEGGTKIYRKFDLNSNYKVAVEPDSEIYFMPDHKEITTSINIFDEYGIYRDTIYLYRKPKVKMIMMANVKSWQQVFVAFDKNTGTLGTEDSIKGTSDFSLLYEFGYDKTKGQNFLQNTEDGTFTYLSAPKLFTLNNLEVAEKQAELKQFFVGNKILVPDSVQSNNVAMTNPIVIRNIRYGFDSEKFSEEDAENIDPNIQFRRMAGVLKDYLHLNAKISSHTDECPLAPYEYNNMELSGKRNNSAVEGLLKYYTGMDTTRLVKCNYDGSYPVDKSLKNYSKNSRGQNCANQYNRRTEFKLLYENRNKYMQDCDCKDESMIRVRIPKEENTSTRTNDSATQGGR